MSQKSPVDVSSLKGKKIVATGLSVDGSGMLFACLLAFYNAGEPGARHKELFFHLPNYEQSKHLPPRTKNFSISEYDFCEVKILTGSLAPGDGLLLSYEIMQ